jgi:Erythromycin esterase
VATDSGTPLKLSNAAVMPLRSLDPAAPLDDLEWLDEAIGDARVVAIGESAHGTKEFYQLRHRLLRYLVERHGFDAYAMESGFVEGWGVNDWVHGGGDELSQVLATGITFLMGLVIQMRSHLEWMRDHNRSAARPVSFYGVDLPGSAVSLLPGIDAVIAYLGQADPAFDGWVNGNSPENGLQPIPATHLAPHMFRRTMAVITANEPDGEIALGITLKHNAIRALANITTSGYGAPTPEWANEFEHQAKGSCRRGNRRRLGSSQPRREDPPRPWSHRFHQRTRRRHRARHHHRGDR